MRLEDAVAVAPTLLDVAFAKAGARTEIAVRSRIEHFDVGRGVLVDHRRFRRQRLLGRERSGHLLVIDDDRCSRVPRDRFGVGGNRGHRLSHITHPAFGQGVLVLDERAHAPIVIKIVAGDDRADAGYRPSRRQIVTPDAGVSVRTLK